MNGLDLSDIKICCKATVIKRLYGIDKRINKCATEKNVKGQIQVYTEMKYIKMGTFKEVRKQRIIQ